MRSDPDARYRALVEVRSLFGWSLDELQEALRQEWEIHYGKRHLDGLSPYEVQADGPIPIRTKVLHRRGLHTVE